MSVAVQATLDTHFEPARQPTMYFIGVTTGKSSIMKVFPRWAEHLGLEDAVIRELDGKSMKRALVKAAYESFHDLPGYHRCQPEPSQHCRVNIPLVVTILHDLRINHRTISLGQLLSKPSYVVFQIHDDAGGRIQDPR